MSKQAAGSRQPAVQTAKRGPQLVTACCPLSAAGFKV